MAKAKEKKYYNLTYPQKSIVTTEQYYGDPHISTISGYLIVKNHLDYELLKKAISIFIENNDAFKIRFEKVNNEVMQYFDDNNSYTAEFKNFKNTDELVDHLNSITFDLFNSKLYYAIVFGTDEGKCGYAFVIHHAITDAWSETIIINQINQIYDALLHGKDTSDFPKTSFLEMIDEENHYLFSDKFVKDKEYWENLYNSSLDLPEIREGKKFAVKANRVLYSIPKKYFDYCAKNKISSFSFFLSAIFIYFSKIYNTKDFVIGTPVLNRTNYQAKNVFGMFISTQSFKQLVDDNIAANSFIENISSSQFSLLRHQKYPFELLQKYYGENFGRKHNLYDILYSYQNARVDTDIKLSFDYESKWVFSGYQADALDISIFDIDNTGTQKIGYDYLTELFDEDDIKALHDRLFYILDQVMDNPDILLKDINIVTEEEAKILIEDFNHTEKDYDHNLTISKLIEQVAAEKPDNIAVVYDGKGLTYSLLNRKANFLASLLRSNGIKPNDVVGIMTYRSFEMVIAQLAILKCGAAYLPIDPAYPKDRISYILEDSNCPLLLTTSQVKLEVTETPFLNIDFDKIGNQDENIENINTPHDLAYVIYTSGSTGRPKGVAIEHQSIVNTLLWRKDFYKFDESFVTLQIPSFSFDSSVEDIFTSLISGAKLVLLKQNNTNFNLPLISKLIKQYKINHFLIVPSFYNILLTELSDSLKEAKIFTVAGEGFSEELVKKHFDLLPNVRLVNEYGPTENSVCSTVYEFDKDHTKIFIGKPITNCKCYVLSENMKVQPFGVRGELYVSGIGISRGYIGRDDLNEERFIKNPFAPSKDKDASYQRMYKTGDVCIQTKDGNLIFCERADFQVKYNGYRINLGEIESTISKVSNNPNAVCLLKKVGAKSLLVAYIEAKEKLDLNYIKKQASKYLPHYMMPSEIHTLAKFPTTPNGKIDRKALEKIEFKKEKEEIIPPRNDLDRIILDVWKEVLHLNEISIDKSIFDIGGDSLSIIAIQSMLYKNNIHTEVQELFENPSIKELSDFIKTESLNQVSRNKNKAFVRLYKDDIEKIEKTNAEYPKNVLLTGATGFLGVHLLDELLSHDSIEKVYCIIRNRPNRSSKERLAEVLDYYFDGKWKKEIDNRIIVLEGDLSRNSFALNPTQYNELLVKVDSIYNCASIVKHFGNYDVFYNSNVLSVQNLILFAKKADCTFNHISTTSVSGNFLVKNTIECDYTENDFYIGQNYQDNVYVHSKFEQEALLFKAQQDGLKVNIYRVGNVMSRIKDGKFQINKFDNAYYKRIYGFIKLGFLPENLKTQYLEFTPVDYLAKSIVELSRYENKVFHLLNDKIIMIDDLIKVLKEYDKTINFISKEAFEKAIKENVSNKILESFITDLDYTDTLDYTTKITINSDITKKYFEVNGLDWPNITEEYLKTFIEDMIKN